MRTNKVVKLAAAIALFNASLAQALPYENRIISLDGRQFFVGDVPRENSDSDIWFYFRQSPWLGELVRNDSVLSDQDVRFLRTGIPANDLVDGINRRNVGLDPYIETDPRYTANGYYVYTQGRGIFTLQPHSSKLNYSISCILNSVDGPFSLCRIRVAYPYATHIALTSNEFFPGPMSEIAHEFEPIAQRMIEIAICLDVTDQTDAERAQFETKTLLENPTLTNCRTAQQTS